MGTVPILIHSVSIAGPICQKGLGLGFAFTKKEEEREQIVWDEVTLTCFSSSFFLFGFTPVFPSLSACRCGCRKRPDH